MILLDTDVCVAYLRGVPDVVAHFHMHLDEDVGVSFMTAAELLYGAAKAERSDEATAKVEEFLSLIEIAQNDMATLKAFGQAKAILERAGLPIPDADILIAATALCRNASPRPECSASSRASAPAKRLSHEHQLSAVRLPVK